MVVERVSWQMYSSNLASTWEPTSTSLMTTCGSRCYSSASRFLDVKDADFESLVQIFVNAMANNCTFSPRQRSLIVGLAAHDRPQHPSSWLRRRVGTLLLEGEPWRMSAKRWGWKEPNTHIVIDRLLRLVPDLKYVHVMRNGLDMCYGPNQNQQNLWGGRFLGPADAVLTPPPVSEVLV